MNTKNGMQAGSVPGAILLIAGCCIGAGMLGLPVISALAGFKPSLLMFVVSWAFMTTTALLLLEVNIWFSAEVSIISMAGRTLGIGGKIVSWLCFLFLFYALGVAYIAGSGELIANFVQGVAQITMPNWVGSLVISLLFAVFVYAGTRTVDLFNRLLMVGLITTYVVLVILGGPHVQAQNLQYMDWSASALVLPVMIISFGFHNLIPTLSTYLQWNIRRLRLAILCGSALALGVYVLWEWLILGLVPIQNQGGGIQQVLQEGEMATHLLKEAAGAVWVVNVAQYFAFFAIVTSFLGNSLSFVDFLADGLHVKKRPLGKLFLCFLVIAPPFILSLIYPRIFLSALNYAGAFGAVILFGILPALMVWSGRYHKNLGQTPLVPGGKWTLGAIICFAVWLMCLQFIDII